MTRTHQLEAAITASASRHLAARRCQSGGAAPAAGVWIETLHAGHKFVQNATFAAPNNRHSAVVVAPRDTADTQEKGPRRSWLL